MAALEDPQRHADVEALEAQAGRWGISGVPVSYTHLRAHETVLDLVCRLLLEKKKTCDNVSE